jgi:hypothetical protein
MQRAYPGMRSTFRILQVGQYGFFPDLLPAQIPRIVLKIMLEDTGFAPGY